ncbi:unnamed protein product [Linum trigynum]|uniref:Uncharacterized protein n=1 Tax=Linum trigynum TaxID=586398 RepID=A0AAV2EFI4_9ROSI
MDRQQSYEPTATIMHSSSIALLQERFRQLERAREMRQQRELFRFFAEAEQQVKPVATAMVVYEPPNNFSQPELLFPSKQQLLISSQKQMKGQCHFDLQVRENPDLANLRSANLLMMQTQYNYFDESEVDTSLHL